MNIALKKSNELHVLLTPSISSEPMVNVITFKFLCKGALQTDHVLQHHTNHEASGNTKEEDLMYSFILLSTMILFFSPN